MASTSSPDTAAATSDTPPDFSETGHPRRWIALVTLLTAGFMNLIDVTIVNVALPTLQSSLSATESQIEWVVAAYILVFALCLLPAGRLGDVVGRRRMFIIGVSIFTLGSALCGVAPDMDTLIAARVLQGIGGGIMTPQTLAIVPAIFPPSERGFVFSFFGLTAGLATVTGPVLGGMLIHVDLFGLDWRPIFLVNIPVGALAIVAALRFIPSLPGAKDTRIDLIGVGLAALTLLLVLFPLVEGRELDWPLWCFVMMIASIPTGWVFLRWQRHRDRVRKPQLLPVELMHNTLFLVGICMVAVLFSGVPGFFFVFAQYLQNGYGLSALQSGLTTLPFSVGVLVASLASGKLGNRWPRRRITVGAVCLAGGMISLRYLTLHMGESIDQISMAPSLLIGGIGLGITIAPLFQVVLSTVESGDAGSASGTLQSFQQVGGAFGVAIMGQIFFSRLQTGVASSGTAASNASTDVFMTAMSQAIIYNALAFVAVALLVRVLPTPAPVSD